MKVKSTKNKLNGKAKVVKHSFSGNRLTKYAGLNPILRFMNKQGLVQMFSSSFPTHWQNATKFGKDQILLVIVMASISGVSRIKKISNFSNDGLIKTLLKLDKGINQNAISATLKKMGQGGARKLQELLLGKNAAWLKKSKLASITLDADSTVKTVCGNQTGAAKGYNPIKKGSKSYHPLLIFVSELKMLYHSWFRTGSAFTSNGITDFLQEVKASLPNTVDKVFFRADSGFFSGDLFDLLEDYNWDYLVKVKLKNLKKLLERQEWTMIDMEKDIAICEFSYKAKGWKKTRKLKAVRTVKEYIEVEFLGGRDIVPLYQYACYISSYDKDATQLHEIYKLRSISETWIEQVKSHTMAGGTLTNNFWANDILWQLGVLAYNISLMMRQKKDRFKKQEHRTFMEWFVEVPAKVTSSGRSIELKMYENHFFREDWEEMTSLLEAA